MLIGELADATGVTAKTLRFYEQRGLLAEPARTDGGYRDYPPAAVARVRFVKDAQAAGFTLAQIDEILTIRDGGQPPCDHVATLVDQRLAEVKQRLHELETVRQQLQSIAARAVQSTPDDCDSYCNLIPATEEVG